MTDDRGIWVGLLDLDEADTVVGVSRPVDSGCRDARILIREHRAPLGQVCVATMPVETLTARSRQAAETSLAGVLHRHAQWDELHCGLGVERDWTAQMACPRHFSSLGDAGVTIVVCTRDRTAGLRNCLLTLQRVSHNPVEIVVVDNAPSDTATRDAVAALAENDQRIRYICQPRPGLSRARNLGLDQARYDIVAFTDDDTMVDSGWPSSIAAAFEADKEVMCVTGLVASSELDTGSQRYFDSRYAWGEAFQPRLYDLAMHRHPSRLYPFSAGIFGTGANFAVRRSALSRLGGFDPLLGAGSLTRGGEDLDMFLRVILAGGRICYVPSALVWHRHRADTQALSEQIYSYGYGLGAYVAKQLLSRQLPVSTLLQGFRQVRTVIGRMRQATHDSSLRADGRRLGLTEVRGVMAGAMCYYRTSRRASSASPGVQ
jgi:GT2 family glycosyltransferase